MRDETYFFWDPTNIYKSTISQGIKPLNASKNLVNATVCDCTGSPNSAVPGTRVRIVTSLLLFSNIYHSNEFLLNNSFTLQMRKKIVMTDVTWKPAFTKVCKSNLNEVS